MTNKKTPSDSGVLRELSLLARAVAGTVQVVSRNLEVGRLTQDSIKTLRERVQKAAAEAKKSPSYAQAKTHASVVFNKSRQEGEKILKNPRGRLAKGLKKIGKDLENLAKRIDR